MRCERCAHWTEELDRTRIAPDTFDTVDAGRAGKCSCPSFIYTGGMDLDVPTDGVIYWDADSYAAGFLTGPEFGCIHWSQRRGQ